MPIPESKLEVWSNQGSTVKSKATADSIKFALSRYELPTNNFQVYLQGSYKNNTNIRGESDVDVVIELTDSFQSNLTSRELKSMGFEDSDYEYDDFKKDVIEILVDYYGKRDVNKADKCIVIEENDNRLPADIIITTTYRNYKNSYYAEGIYFKTNNDNRIIINYPKKAYDNGCEKNKNTLNWFKPVIRVFKNMRRAGNIEAPSYYIQCLLYNVPDNCYGNTFGESVCNILNYLNEYDISSFSCQHNQFKLFGTSPEQWSIPKAEKFISSMIEMWNNWSY